MQIDNPDTLSEIAKAAPPIAVGSLHLAGVAISDWVFVATLIYTVLQTFFLIKDRIARHRAKKVKDGPSSPAS